MKSDMEKLDKSPIISPKSLLNSEISPLNSWESSWKFIFLLDEDPR